MLKRLVFSVPVILGLIMFADMVGMTRSSVKDRLSTEKHKEQATGSLSTCFKLYWAVVNSNTELIRELLSSPQKTDWFPEDRLDFRIFMAKRAAKENRRDIVEVMLKYGNYSKKVKREILSLLKV